jgi:hypothetical protein
MSSDYRTEGMIAVPLTTKLQQEWWEAVSVLDWKVLDIDSVYDVELPAGDVDTEAIGRLMTASELPDDMDMEYVVDIGVGMYATGEKGWVHLEANWDGYGEFNVDLCAGLVQLFLQHFKLPDQVSFYWVCHGDGISMGATVVTKEEVYWKSDGALLKLAVEDYNRTKTKKAAA